jgi:hypothetical protein
VADNFTGGSPVALSGFGRVARRTNVIDDQAQNEGNPRLYEIDIPLSSVDAKRRLTSIDFTNQSADSPTAKRGRSLAVFGVSGLPFNLEPGVAAFSSAKYTVASVEASVVIILARSGGSDGELKVGYATADDTAKAGVDYMATSGTITWADGDSASKSFSVPVLAGRRAQDVVSLLLNLTPVSGDATTLGTPSQATVDIQSANASTAPIQGVFLLSPPTNLTVAQGRLIELYVDVQAAENAYKQVEFFVSEAATPDVELSLGSSTALRDKKIWAATKVGNFILKARATDVNGGSKTTAEPITVVALAATDAGPQVELLGNLDDGQFAQGQTLTLVASAVDSNGDPLASVQFYADGKPLGAPVIPQTLGARTTPWQTRQSGIADSHSLATLVTAVRQGVQLITATGTDKNGVSAVAEGKQLFGKALGGGALTCTIVNPASQATLPARTRNQTVTVSATANDGRISRVELLYNSISVGALTAAPYTFTLPPLGEGVYALSAVATDANGLSATSEPRLVRVVGTGDVDLPTVTAEASVPLANASNGQKGEFTIARDGDISKELVVSYIITGSAMPGVDYKALGNSKKIKAGASTVVVRVTPLAGGVAPGEKKTVKFNLLSGQDYTVGSGTAAKVKIVGSD